MKSRAIIATLLMTLLGSQMGTAFGSGLGRSDFDENPDHCLEPYLPRGYTFNGTWIQGNDLNCYGLKPLSDFRVTIEDQRRHHLDKDYDGIGCENNDN